MKNVQFLVIGVLVMLVCFSCDDSDSDTSNKPPQITLAAELTGVDPFTYHFTTEADDPEGDPLTYTWDFGEGTVREGNSEETFSFAAGATYLVKVSVSDGNHTSSISSTVTSKSVSLGLDPEQTYQTIDGFGGAGAAIPFYLGADAGRYDQGDGYFDEAWLDLMVNDWGATIFRAAVSPSYEAFPGDFDENRKSPLWEKDVNNQNIPTSNYYYDGVNTPTGPVGSQLSTTAKYAKALKEKIEANGEELKYILSVWTPPAWMKTNGNHMKGSLKTEHFDEFATFLASYIKKFKELSGVDPYALSIQNEPNLEHPEWTFGCSYTGNNYRDLLKMVNDEFIAQDIDIHFYGPETVRFMYRMTNIMDPVFADDQAHPIIDIMATHSYGGDGIALESNSASEWETLYNYTQQKGTKPFWMSETEENGGWQGALTGAKRILSALKFGKVSAWVWWSVGAPGWETNIRNGFTQNGVTSSERQKYWTSKNFYKFIRPGAVQIGSDSDNDLFGIVAFKHEANNVTTIVAINDSSEESVVVLDGEQLPDTFEIYVTSETSECELKGTLEGGKNWFVMAPKSVYTLQSVPE